MNFVEGFRNKTNFVKEFWGGGGRIFRKNCEKVNFVEEFKKERKNCKKNEIFIKRSRKNTNFVLKDHRK